MVSRAGGASMIDWTVLGGLKTLPGSLPVAGDSSASIEAPYVEMLAALLSASGARAVLETGTHIGLTAAALAHTFGHAHRDGRARPGYVPAGRARVCATGTQE